MESSQNISNSGTFTFSKNTEKEKENSSKEFYFSISNRAQNEKENSTNDTKEGQKILYYVDDVDFNNGNLNDDYYDNFYK